MKKVDKDLLKTAAHNLMFEMSDEQIEKIIVEFNAILGNMELINSIPHIDEAEPMVFPFDMTSSWLREDIIEEPLTRDQILKNSSDVVNGQIRLPKVVK